MKPTIKQVIRGSVYGGIVLAAIGGAYLATRSTEEPAVMAAAAGHDGHATASGDVDLARSVSLTPDQARRIGVTYAEATVGSVEQEIRTVGQLSFDETRVKTISPRLDGWVEQLLVNATGQRVAIGQPLLTIYSPMVVQAQEEILLARQLERDLSDGDASARRSAHDLVVSARRRLDYLEVSPGEIAEVERTGRVRRAVTLRSSVGGYVLEKKVVAGQRIMAGDALYTVADLSTVWMEGDVFEQDLAHVRLGQTVRGEVASMPGEQWMGRITYISPTLDPQTRTVKVRVALPNGDFRLKPGMYATLRITAAGRAGVLTIPRGAVLSTGERSIVFVREANGHLTAREVALGAVNDDRMEILRGLAAGETVVASATFLVDAESNLGKSLGGMGNMPGMDVGTPPKALPAKKVLPP